MEEKEEEEEENDFFIFFSKKKNPRPMNMLLRLRAKGMVSNVFILFLKTGRKPLHISPIGCMPLPPATNCFNSINGQKSQRSKSGLQRKPLEERSHESQKIPHRLDSRLSTASVCEFELPSSNLLAVPGKGSPAMPGHCFGICVGTDTPDLFPVISVFFLKPQIYIKEKNFLKKIKS